MLLSTLLATLPAAAGSLTAVAVTPDGRFTATADPEEKLARVWRLSDGRLLAAYPVDVSVVDGLHLAANGTLVVNGRSRSTVVLPDGAVRTYQGPAFLDTAGTRLLVAEPSALRVLAVPSLEEVRSIALPAPLDTFETKPSAGSDLRFAAFPVGPSDDGEVRVFDLQAGSEVATLSIPKGSWLELSDDGTMLGVRDDGHDEPSFAIHEVATGRKVRAIPTSAAVYDAAWTADGRFLAIATRDDVQVWTVAGDARTADKRYRTGTLYQGASAAFFSDVIWEAVAISPDGAHVVAGAFSTTGSTFGVVRSEALSLRTYSPTDPVDPPLPGILAAAFAESPEPAAAADPDALPPLGEWTRPVPRVDFEVKLPDGMTWGNRSATQAPAKLSGSSLALTVYAFPDGTTTFPSATAEDLAAAYRALTYATTAKFTPKDEVACHVDGGLQICAASGTLKEVVAIGAQLLLVTPVEGSGLRGGLIVTAATSSAFKSNKGLVDQLPERVRARTDR